MNRPKHLHTCTLYLQLHTCTLVLVHVFSAQLLALIARRRHPTSTPHQYTLLVHPTSTPLPPLLPPQPHHALSRAYASNAPRMHHHRHTTGSRRRRIWTRSWPSSPREMHPEGRRRRPPRRAAATQRCPGRATANSSASASGRGRGCRRPRRPAGRTSNARHRRARRSEGAEKKTSD